MSLNLYALPMMLGDQYILSSILRETRDTVTFAGMQKDMRREVLVETLRPEAMKDSDRVQDFLETAHLQSRILSKDVACTLELFEAEGTWHLIKERINGEPLDVMVSSGRKLPAVTICGLFLQLCHLCLFVEAHDLNARPLTLESVYLMDYSFRFDNLVCTGKRSQGATKQLLASLARELMPLLDMTSPCAGQMRELLNRVCYSRHWDVFITMMLDEELVRMQMDIVDAEREARLAQNQNDIADNTHRHFTS